MTDIPGVGAIVFDDRRRLLLVQRANPPAQGRWSVPGGHVEPGESDEAATLRELAEETGLTGRIVSEAGRVERPTGDGRMYRIRDFVVAVSDTTTLRSGDDAADVAWFTRSELLAAATSPGLVDALREWGLLPQ